MTGEALPQSQVRLTAAQAGHGLWRNNSGAFEDKTGRWVRYGLGNDSKRLNQVWASSDLIGCVPVMVTPEMVGAVLGRFVACEMKPVGWKGPTTQREVAQANFHTTINQLGGRGFFATSVKDYFDALRQT